MRRPPTRRGVAPLGRAAALGAASPTGRARAATSVFRWGTDVPDSYPLNVRARRAAEEIRKATDGRLDLQLVADTDVTVQVRWSGFGTARRGRGQSGLTGAQGRRSEAR